MKTAFGAFEFETTTGELRRDGEVVRLQSQPAQVLAMLVEHAGDVVTREALRDAIWGADTFVDFDKGLNFAVAQVRAALNDSADAPTFIRTLPKRGYQFIATLEQPRPVRNVWLPALAAAVLLAVAAGSFWTWRGRRVIEPSNTIAIVAFDNETGLPDLDRYAQTLTDAVVSELTVQAGRRLNVIGNASALRTPPRSVRDLTAIGSALHAGYVVIGQVQRDGDRLLVLAHLIRLPEQTHLWVVRMERRDAGLPVAAVDVAQRVSREFLSKL